MRTLLILSFLFIAMSNSIAQTGTIRGFVYDKENGEPAIFCKIIVLNQDSVFVSGQMTDFDGLFSIPKIAEGVYDVQLQSLGYETLIIEDIDLKANAIETFKWELQPVKQELREIRIESYKTIHNTDG